jgi:hypothetical protein
LEDLAVTTAKIAAGSVTSAKIANFNVTNEKLATDSVTTVKIANLNVTTAKIADNNITTAKIADANVTEAKLAGTNPQIVLSNEVSFVASTDVTGTVKTIITAPSSTQVIVVHKWALYYGGDWDSVAGLDITLQNGSYELAVGNTFFSQANISAFDAVYLNDTPVQGTGVQQRFNPGTSVAFKIDHTSTTGTDIKIKIWYTIFDFS